MTLHAQLSPSGADRWINCPGSVTASKNQPSIPTTVYALGGSVAHAFSEKIIVNNNVPKLDKRLEWGLKIKVLKESNAKGDELVRITKLMGQIRVDQEMLNNVLVYTDIVQKLSTHRNIEKRVYFTKECHGTVDCYFIAGGILWIFDLKYGVKKVKALNNPQLAIYALGALAENKDMDITKISMNIVQPRVSNPVDSWDISRKKFENVWAPKIKAAIENTKTKTDVFAPGKYCYWCNAYKTCPHKKQEVQNRAKETFANA